MTQFGDIPGTREMGPEAYKIIRGTVNAAGTVAQGSGFTVTKNATGDYTVTFSTAFSSPPSVVVSSVDGNVASLVLDGLPLAGSARVMTKTNANAAVDAVFAFVAVGPG